MAASHDLDAYTKLLKRDGTLVLVGAPEHPHPTPDVMTLLLKRRALAGSIIGGLAETQEMLDFCAANGIVADIEMIPIQQIEAAYERMLRERRQVPVRDRQRLPRGLSQAAVQAGYQHVLAKTGRFGPVRACALNRMG